MSLLIRPLLGSPAVIDFTLPLYVNNYVNNTCLLTAHGELLRKLAIDLAHRQINPSRPSSEAIEPIRLEIPYSEDLQPSYGRPDCFYGRQAWLSYDQEDRQKIVRYKQIFPEDTSTSNNDIRLICVELKKFNLSVEDFKPLLKLADDGDMEAQYILGCIYPSGQKEKAFKYIKLAADQGHREAEFYLASFYQHNLNVPVNNEETCRLYQSAAAKGHARAMYWVAKCYKKGIGTPVDLKEAFKFEALHFAKSGNAPDWYIAFHDKEIDVPLDFEKAAELYQAHKDFEPTQPALAFLYENGFGVKKNLKEAVRLYTLHNYPGKISSKFYIHNYPSKISHKLYKMKRDGIINENNEIIDESSKASQKSAGYFKDVCLNPFKSANLFPSYREFSNCPGYENKSPKDGVYRITWPSIYSPEMMEQGEFKNGLLNGKGVQQYPTGDVFEGEFRDGARVGGKFIYSNGHSFLT